MLMQDPPASATESGPEGAHRVEINAAWSISTPPRRRHWQGPGQIMNLGTARIDTMRAVEHPATGPVDANVRG